MAEDSEVAREVETAEDSGEVSTDVGEFSIRERKE